MKCERCGENPAQVQYTEIRDGKAERLQICSACAEKLGFEGQGKPLGAQPGLTGKVVGVVSVTSKLEPSEPLPTDSVRCPSCGTTGADLRERSRFGCPKCYEAFDESLDPLFRRVHGAIHHRGRLPGGQVAEPVDLAKLEQELEAAIANEDFEEAARVRDRLRRAGSPRRRRGSSGSGGEPS